MAVKPKEYLSTCKPESVLSPNDYQQYKEMMTGMWPHVITLNTYVYLLSRILAFPFGLLGIDPEPFWTALQRALFDGSVLAIWGLVFDRDRRSCTLLDVKKHLSQALQDGHAKEALDELFRKEFPEGWESAFRKKIEEIRHNYVAHYNLRKHARPSPAEIEKRRLTLSDLETARDKVVGLFDILALDVDYRVLPPEYDPHIRFPAQEDKRTDIERILDRLARESYTLNLPERNPALWPYKLAHLSPHQRDQLNHFRHRFGLPGI